MQTILPALPIALALAGSFAAAITPRHMSHWLASALAALLCAGYAITLVGGGATTAPFWGIPELGIAGGLRLDGLAVLFCLLITGIGALVFLYAGRYLLGDAGVRRLIVMLLFFMMAMLGAVSADDVIILFVFWELTSLTSFFLVGYRHEDPEARHAALQALLVTAGGGLALLAGLILLAMAAGTTSLSGIIAAREQVLAHPGAMPAMLLLIAGCFTKSAQWPFHFWLPNAMAAPTPVSAYLHSATMVKLGIYLLARMSPLYAGVPLWHQLLMLFGLVTAIVATVLSLRATDLKRILAYTTVAALGVLTLLLGIGSPAAAVAAVAFLIVHAFYKAALFLVAGIVDHETGLRDAARLGGLRRAMPLTALGAGVAALSMAGIPPFLGFVAKEAIYEATLAHPSYAGVLLSGMFLVNAGTIAIAAVMSIRLFLGRPQPTPQAAHDPGAAMLAGPLVLAVLGLAAGVLVTHTHAGWIAPAAAAILGTTDVGIRLSLWHGVTPLLGLSLLTVLCGVGLYALWPRLGSALRRLQCIDRFGPARGYDACLAGLITLSRHTTMFFQHGNLRGYLRLLFAVAGGVLLLTLTLRDGWRLPGFSLDVLDVRYLTFAGLIAGAVGAAAATTAFGAVIAAGLTGFSTALVFLLFGAPDVSFTQFSVETLMVVILATTLARLPLPQHDRRNRRQKSVDAVIALALGGGLTATLLAVLADPLDIRLSQWFGENSLLAAHGHNVVNVILVDFRALDTLGEITVLSLSAFAVYSLLRGRSRPAGDASVTHRRRP